MNGVTYLTGPAGSGWKEALYKRVIGHMVRGEEAVLIVPEQATFEVERRLSRDTGGLIGVQVLSPARLIERVLEDTGRKRPDLDAQGFAMAVRRIADDLAAKEKLSVYARAVGQTGFCTELAELFTSFRHAMIDAAELKEKTADIGSDSLMGRKLADITAILSETERWLSERKYMTVDDGRALAVSLVESSFLRGAHIYVDLDGLAAPTEQFWALYGAMLGSAAGMTCGFTQDPLEEEEPLFRSAVQRRERLDRIAEERGLSVTVKEFSRKKDGVPALDFLAGAVFRMTPKTFEGDTSPVEIRSLPNRATETEAAADRILSLARAGVRYREIAVLVPENGAYAPLLKRSFSLRGIPLFMDEKRPFVTFAAVDTPVAALRCVADGFRTEDVLRLIKNGYVGLSFEQIELFENYCLRFGIRGSLFLSEFTRGLSAPEGVNPAEAERTRETAAAAERIRQRVIPPLERLRTGLREKTASEKLKALYGYLEEIGLAEQLSKRATELIGLGRPREAAEHSEIWRHLIGLFDRIAEILGDVPMSRDAFLSVLEEGLSVDEVRVVPDTADAVLIGEVSHTVPKGDIRVLFVLGANEGQMPHDRHDDGLFSNSELSLLRDKCRLELGSGTEAETAEERFRLMMAFSAPKERLYFSYPMMIDKQESMRASFLTRLMGCMPGLKEKSGYTAEDTVSERVGFRRLCETLREGDAGTEDERAKRAEEGRALKAWFSRSAEYGLRTKRMERLSNKTFTQPEALSGTEAEAIYRADQPMSVSRLEQFNHCPFRHFVEYGLRAKPRKEAGLEPSDIGSFYHAVCEMFLRRLIDEQIDPKELTEARIGELLDEIVPRAIALFADGLITADPGLRMTLFLLTDTVRTAVTALVRQLAAGSFRTVSPEARFGEGQLFPPIILELDGGKTVRLEGIIDRVDEAPVESGRLYRVIDYKTNGRKFDYGAIEAGLTLQLPLYLSAVIRAGAARTAAGMYYMRLAMAPGKEQDTEEKMREQFRLMGITLKHADVLNATEENGCERSEVLSGVKYKKDGDVSGRTFCSDEEMERLLERAQTVAKETAEEMLAGRIDVAPTDRACEYCRFRSVCGFDPKLGCRPKAKKSVKKEEFFDKAAERQ